jgi:hypothetical protein
MWVHWPFAVQGLHWPLSHSAALVLVQSACATHWTQVCEPGSQSGFVLGHSSFVRHCTQVFEVVSHFGVVPEQSELWRQPTQVLVLSLQTGLVPLHFPPHALLPLAPTAPALPPVPAPRVPPSPPVPAVPPAPPPSKGVQFALFEQSLCWSEQPKLAANPDSRINEEKPPNVLARIKDSSN